MSIESQFDNVLNEKGRPLRDKLVEAFIATDLYRSDGTHLWEYQAEFRCWAVLTQFLNKRLKNVMPCHLRTAVTSSLLDGVVQDLIENPDIFIDFAARRNKNILNLKTNAFNLITCQPYTVKKTDYCSYYANFELLHLEKVSIDEAPNFKKFIQSSFGEDKNSKKMKLLLQIMIYLISDVAGAKKMFFLLGAPHSGKSVILNLIEYVVGAQERSIISMHEFGTRFKLVGLLNSRLNLSHEVRNTNVHCLDVLKKIVANEPILVEQKGKDAIEIKPATKLLFAGNALPKLGEVDDQAVVTRLVILRFPQSIERDKWDIDLLSKLKNEVNVIFTLALKELPELISNNFCFEEPADSRAFLINYGQSQNSVRQFVEDVCELDVAGRTQYGELLNAYKIFCTENAVKVLDEFEVKQHISMLSGVQNRKVNKKGKSTGGFWGIRFKDCNTKHQDTNMYDEKSDQDE